MAKTQANDTNKVVSLNKKTTKPELKITSTLLTKHALELEAYLAEEDRFKREMHSATVVQTLSQNVCMMGLLRQVFQMHDIALTKSNSPLDEQINQMLLDGATAHPYARYTIEEIQRAFYLLPGKLVEIQRQVTERDRQLELMGAELHLLRTQLKDAKPAAPVAVPSPNSIRGYDSLRPAVNEEPAVLYVLTNAKTDKFLVLKDNDLLVTSHVARATSWKSKGSSKESSRISNIEVSSAEEVGTPLQRGFRSGRLIRLDMLMGYGVVSIRPVLALNKGYNRGAHHIPYF